MSNNYVYYRNMYIEYDKNMIKITYIVLWTYRRTKLKLKSLN